MPISAALKRVYASAPTDTRYIECISFSHSRFSETHHFNNDLRDWTFKPENNASTVFRFLPFSIVLPEVNKEGSYDLQLAISNIGKQMITELELANNLPTEPIVCTLRLYLDQANSLPQNSPPLEMTVNSVEANKEVITAVARRADILNRPFPNKFYTTVLYPGLDR